MSTKTKVISIQEFTENVSQSSTVADAVASDLSQVSKKSTSIASRSDDLTQKAEKLKTLSLNLRKMIDVF